MNLQNLRKTVELALWKIPPDEAKALADRVVASMTREMEKISEENSTRLRLAEAVIDSLEECDFGDEIYHIDEGAYEQWLAAKK